MRSLALVAVLAASLAHAGELEVEVGGAIYDATDGKPLEITTPKGERLRLTVRRKQLLHWNGEGVQFDYPREMTPTVERGEGLVTITVNSTSSPLVMIQLFNLPTDPAALEAMMMKELKANFVQRGAAIRVADKPIRRNVHGVDRSGKQLVVEIAKEKQVLEIFALRMGNRAVILNLQYNQDDEALANKQFPAILRTFE